jgi:hypothetical protein
MGKAIGFIHRRGGGGGRQASRFRLRSFFRSHKASPKNEVTADS